MAAKYEAVLDAGGDARWLVMVHGMSQDHRAFGAQADAFKDRHRILMIDLPGHGLSADLPGPFGHLELAAHVAGAMDQAGVERCDYWGTHTGTALALLMACERPDRFRSLVLEGPVLPGRNPPSAQAVLERVRDTARTRGVAAARRQWFSEGGWFQVMHQRPEECREAAQWAIISDFAGAPWLDDGPAAPVAPIDDRLPSLDSPVLIYNGEHDVADFLDAADRLEALLPRVQRATIAHAGGFPAWEFPDRVNRLVADFLAAALVGAEVG